MKKLNPLAQNFFRDNIFNLFMAVLGTTVLSIAILCVPQLIQLLIDFLANKNDYSIWRILLLAAGILVMELFAGICIYFFRTRFSAKAVAEYRKYAYNYLINGSALSGGERQRINIARSLLRRTKLLLADEITAALDNETGYKVMNSLIDINDITEVIVLHDLDSRILNKIDKIFALKDGKIVEEGTFSDLIKKKGYFYSLYSIDNS